VLSRKPKMANNTQLTVVTLKPIIYQKSGKYCCFSWFNSDKYWL